MCQDGDGCSGLCRVEQGYVCSSSPANYTCQRWVASGSRCVEPAFTHLIAIETSSLPGANNSVLLALQTNFKVLERSTHIITVTGMRDEG
jgi:hypothetical protein